MSLDATIPSGTVEGRGQGNPGPSTFARPLSSWAMLAVFAVVLAGAMVQFVLGTLLVEQGERIPTAAAVSLLLGVLLVAVGERARGRRPQATTRSLGALSSGLALALGVVIGTVAPSIYVMNQFSDAPSGTLVLFWTTVVPGALLLVVGAARRWGARFSAASLAVVAAFCATGVLGNWERPSSFSLLARHVPQQLALGAGAALLVVALAALAWLMRAHGWRPVAFMAGVGALAGGFGLIVVSGDPLGALTMVFSPLVLIFAVSAVASSAAVLVALVRGIGPVAASGLMLVPSAMSLLVFLEAAVGALGPEPILREPVAWASAGVVMVLVTAVSHAVTIPAGSDSLGEDAASSSERPRMLVLGLRVAASAGTILAAMGLAAGALDASVLGRYTSGQRFAATFVMRGWETAGGWIAFGMALVVLAAVLSRPRPVVEVLTAVALGVTAMAWKVVGSTPLHTWVTWIPADVQQDYGSEYARIAFEAVPVWLQTASVAMALVLGAYVMFDGVARLRAKATAEESESL